MGHDGNSMVTPNSNTNDSTFWDFITDKIKSKPATGTLPIASGINPDSTKYYVSNYLGHSISVIDMASGNKINDINLLQNYNPVTGAVGEWRDRRVANPNASQPGWEVRNHGKYLDRDDHDHRHICGWWERRTRQEHRVRSGLPRCQLRGQERRRVLCLYHQQVLQPLNRTRLR